MTPEEQQMLWLKNIAALQQGGFKPSDMVNYGARDFNFDAYDVNSAVPGTQGVKVSLRSLLQPEDKSLGLPKNDEVAMKLGFLLKQIMLGQNQPVPQHPPFRVNQGLR